MARTLDERIAETKEKISQYENQVKRLIQQQKQAERKTRTRRLIERGAILESLLDGADTLTKLAATEQERFAYMVQVIVRYGNAYAQAMTADSGVVMTIGGHE